MPKLALNHDDWEPSDELLDAIDKKKHKGLRQRDRAELVVAAYASAHGGNSPTFEELGEIMGCGRGNAYRFAMELTMDSQRRAVHKGGKFWLVNSKYTHPLVRQLYPEALLEEGVEPLTENEMNVLRREQAEFEFPAKRPYRSQKSAVATKLT